MVANTPFLRPSIHRIDRTSNPVPGPRRAEPSLNSLPSRAPDWTCLVKGPDRAAALRALDETSPVWPDPGMGFRAGSGRSGRSPEYNQKTISPDLFRGLLEGNPDRSPTHGRPRNSLRSSGGRWCVVWGAVRDLSIT